MYSLRLSLALNQAPRVEVMVINPRAAKDYQRARLTRAKTDRVDALGPARLPGAHALCAPGRRPPRQCLASSNSPGSMEQLKAVNAPASRRVCTPSKFTPEEGGAAIAHDLALNIAHLERRLKALAPSGARPGQGASGAPRRGGTA